MKRSSKVTIALLLASICAIAGARVVTTYNEYYGSGAPYYGQTTNMDKWQSPIADLTLSGIVAAVCLILGFIVLTFRPHHPPGRDETSG